MIMSNFTVTLGTEEKYKHFSTKEHLKAYVPCVQIPVLPTKWGESMRIYPLQPPQYA